MSEKNIYKYICLQVHNDYLTAGGETKSAQLIANTLEKNGIQVIRYYRSNNEIRSSVTGKIITGINSIYNMQTVREVEDLLLNYHIDFALVHNTSPLISNSLYSILSKYRVPIIKYMQNYNLLCLNGALDHGKECVICRNNLITGVKNKCYKNSFNYSLLKYISKIIFDIKYRDKISSFIAISEYVKSKHIEYSLPENKIHTIYHFVDSKIGLEDNCHNKYNYFLYMGRLSQEKGIITLIRAIGQNPNYRLKIMGTGVDENKLRDYVDRNGYINVEFLGYCEGEKKDKIISQAKALVVPSEWDEPFGRIVIEAYQHGTPVIVSNKGGLPELVDIGKTGYVFEAGNINELNEKLHKIDMITSEKYRQIRENCLNTVFEKFTENAYFKRFIEVLESII